MKPITRDSNVIRDIAARKIAGLPAQPSDAEKNRICRGKGCDNDLSEPGHFDGFCKGCASEKFKAGDWHTPPLDSA